MLQHSDIKTELCLYTRTWKMEITERGGRKEGDTLNLRVKLEDYYPVLSAEVNTNVFNRYSLGVGLSFYHSPQSIVFIRSTKLTKTN